MIKYGGQHFKFLLARSMNDKTHSGTSHVPRMNDSSIINILKCTLIRIPTWCSY